MGIEHCLKYVFSDRSESLTSSKNSPEYRNFRASMETIVLLAIIASYKVLECRKKTVLHKFLVQDFLCKRDSFCTQLALYNISCFGFFSSCFFAQPNVLCGYVVTE